MVSVRLASIVLLSMLVVASLPTTAADPPFFSLTINGPSIAPEDKTVSFGGHWRASAAPYNGLGIRLYVDGERVASGVPFFGQWGFQHVFQERGEYVVQAIGDEGLPTETRSPLLTVTVAGPPGPVQGLVAEPVAGDLSVLIDWEAPADDGGAPIRDYVVERRTVLKLFPNTDSGWVSIASLGSATTGFHDTRLASGWEPLITEHTYRVRASHAGGAAPYVTVPVTGDAPGAPTVVATPDSPSRTKVVLSAAPDGGPTQWIGVERSLDGGATWHSYASAEGDSATYLRAVLTDEEPLFRAWAASLVGATRGEPTAPTGDVPGQPLDVEVGISDKVRISWSAPTTGGPAQRYQVLEDGVVIASLPYWANSTAFVGGPGQREYVVVARNIVGAGPASAPVTVALERSSAPLDLSLMLTEGEYHATATLTWSTPNEDGGAPIQGYDIYRQSGAGSRSKVGSTNATTFTFTESRLGDGQTHTYEVHARTAAGPGVPANVSGTVSDFDWEVDVTFGAFTVCEGSACTTVADGGTYTATQGAAVRYEADLVGTLTRQDQGMGNKSVLVTMWESGNDELATSDLEQTDSQGDYFMHWPGHETTASGGCRDVVLETRHRHSPITAMHTFRFTLCA